MGEKEQTVTAGAAETTAKKNDDARGVRVFLKWLFRIIQGAIIGVGAILPGVSGGVLCVVFGIYQPMMELLAHPFKTFKKHARLLLPVLIGWVIGFVGLARLVEWMFSSSYTVATWLFIGLIAGMLPSMYRDAGKQGRPARGWIAFFISTALILILLFFVNEGSGINIQPNIWWFFVCGVLWGVSMVVPGLSSSSLLIFLGLYQPMTAGIADLVPGVIFPLIVGALLTILLSARAVDYLLKKHYTVMFHMILGFVVASTIMIIPRHAVDYGSLSDIVLSPVCCVLGFAVALLMDRIGIHRKRTKQALPE